MFDAGPLTFQEYMMAESLPLATIQQAVLGFLQGCNDADCLTADGVDLAVLDMWQELVALDIVHEDEDSEFEF